MATPHSLPHASQPSTATDHAPPRPQVVALPWFACRLWITRGWHDFTAMPAASAAYGGLFVLSGFIITIGLHWADALYLITPMIAGFLLIAPALAVGFYELSRRRENREPASFLHAITAWRRNSFHLLTAGLVLMLFLMIWVRLAALIFAVAFPYTSPSASALWEALWSWEGLAFLGFGIAIGGVMAATAFVFGAISLPMMVDRRCDVFTAAFLSAQAVLLNIPAMITWAAALTALTALGLASGFLGLMITLPLAGHATWHAYRALVRWPDDPR